MVRIYISRNLAEKDPVLATFEAAAQLLVEEIADSLELDSYYLENEDDADTHVLVVEVPAERTGVFLSTLAAYGLHGFVADVETEEERQVVELAAAAIRICVLDAIEVVGEF